MGITIATTLGIIGIWIVYLILLVLLFELDQRNIAKISASVYVLYAILGIIGCSILTSVILGFNLTSKTAWLSSSGKINQSPVSP
jgi:hypothetical protein